MTIDTTISPGGGGGAGSIARRLDALDASLDRAVRATRRRNVITLVLAIISLCLIAFYLRHAHHSFVSWDANQVADYGQARLVEYMPDAAQDLKKSLRKQAPSVIANGEQRLRDLPEHFADKLEQTVEKQITDKSPEAEEHLYQALKAGIAEADAHVQAAGGATGSDEQRFKTMLDTLAHVYGTETIKFLDQLHGNYKEGSGDVIGYLAMLADGQHLTPQQQSQRTMIHNFLILAREYHANSSGAAGDAQPAGDVQRGNAPAAAATTTRPSTAPAGAAAP